MLEGGVGGFRPVWFSMNFWFASETTGEDLSTKGDMDGEDTYE